MIQEQNLENKQKVGFVCTWKSVPVLKKERDHPQQAFHVAVEKWSGCLGRCLV